MSLKKAAIATLGIIILNTSSLSNNQYCKQDTDSTKVKTVTNHDSNHNHNNHSLEHKVKHFNTYPYAFQNELTVEHNVYDTIFKIIMYNRLGQVVRPQVSYDETKEDKHLIHFNTLYIPNDQYFVRFEGKSSTNKPLLEINKVVKY